MLSTEPGSPRCSASDRAAFMGRQCKPKSCEQCPEAAPELQAVHKAAPEGHQSQKPHVTPTSCHGSLTAGQTKQLQLPLQDSPVKLSHIIQIHLSTYFTNCPAHGKRKERQVIPAKEDSQSCF